MPDVRPVPVAMASLYLLLLLPLVLSIGCARHADETRPSSVPPGAVLLTSPWPSPPSRVWVSCETSHHDPRRFFCTFFDEASGVRQSRGLFVLMQGDESGAPRPLPLPGAVPPARTPAPLPQTLQLRGFDRLRILAQPPWLLVPAADPPIKGDPPDLKVPASTPRPA